MNLTFSRASFAFRNSNLEICQCNSIFDYQVEGEVGRRQGREHFKRSVSQFLSVVCQCEFRTGICYTHSREREGESDSQRSEKGVERKAAKASFCLRLFYHFAYFAI